MVMKHAFEDLSVIERLALASAKKSDPRAARFCAFPRGFTWGVATSAYQIEGAAAEDGRGPSVWDTFSHRSGTIAMGHNGDQSTDHYHRFKEDVALMKELGIGAYRFSVSWSRIFPAGPDKLNPKGLDFYSQLVDALRSAGIEPWMTLFHWDLPQWAEDRYRGWESIECAKVFADYAAEMAEQLGDRLAGVFTMNEFMCFLDKGYTAGNEVFAPGKNVSRKVLNQSRHHAIYAHGLAARAVRQLSPSAVRVGLAENIPGVVPVLENAQDIAAAKEAMRELSGMYLTPILEGHYHPAYLEDQGSDAPVYTDEQMKVISTPLDFVGLNLYAPIYVRHDASAPRGWSIVPCDENYPRMNLPWLLMGPSVLYWAPQLASQNWNPPAIYITENGCASVDHPTESGEVWDLGRVMYLQQYLMYLHRAITEGCPVKGYFLWSLIDNFEWARGYTQRFGIYHVDFETFQRTPKLSARFYSDLIRRNALGGTL